MSYTNSEDSCEDISIYETPMASLNTSVAESTRLDSSLFGDTLSTGSHAIDDRVDSMAASVVTDTTLRPTRSPTDTRDDSESAVWLNRQLMSTCEPNVSDMNEKSRCVLLKKLVSELDCEHLELMSIQHQIQSLNIRCKSISDNIVSKTNFMNSLVNDMIVNSKQMAHKEVQTDPIDNDLSFTDNHQMNADIVRTPKRSITQTNVSVIPTLVSERQLQTACEMKSNKRNTFTVQTELLDDMKESFNRLPALVKGFLTRRLMKTDKVIQKIETIRETTQLLTSYHNFKPNKKITQEDLNFHKRLIIQLENSCHEFHDIFFNYPKKSQMALIRRSREQFIERQFRNSSVLSNTSYLTSNTESINSSKAKTVSSATKRVLERKNRTNQSKSETIDTYFSPQKSSSKKNTLSPKPLSSTAGTSGRESRTPPKNPSRRSQRNVNKTSTVKRNITFIKK